MSSGNKKCLICGTPLGWNEHAFFKFLLELENKQKAAIEESYRAAIKESRQAAVSVVLADMLPWQPIITGSHNEGMAAFLANAMNQGDAGKCVRPPNIQQEETDLKKNDVYIHPAYQDWIERFVKNKNMWIERNDVERLAMHYDLVKQFIENTDNASTDEINTYQTYINIIDALRNGAAHEDI